jgi:hypothetical protein
MADTITLAPAESPNIVPKKDESAASDFIEAWTVLFMVLATALKLEGGKVIAIAEAGEYLRISLGVGPNVLLGGRRGRRRMGGDPSDLDVQLLENIEAKGPVAIRGQIAVIKRQLADGKAKALAKFKSGPSVLGRVFRALGAVGIALLPLTGELTKIALKIKAAQIQQAATVAAVTGPATALATLAMDKAVLGLDKIDAGFAAVGKGAVEGASAVGGFYTSIATRISGIYAQPGTRGGDAKAIQEMLEKWSADDKLVQTTKDYYTVFNQSSALQIQGVKPGQPAGTDTSIAQVQPLGTTPEQGKIAPFLESLMGLKNLDLPLSTYVYMAGLEFRKHTITYLTWSNTIAMMLAGILAEDPATVVLCLIWVLSALSGVTWLARFVDALSTKAELDTTITLLEKDPKQDELKQLQEELERMEKQESLKLMNAAGGRRSTSRRLRRASGPRRTRRSFSGRHRGYSRRRRE